MVLIRSRDDGETTDLPPGVSKADWFFEQRRWQNPRIRHLLGCVRMLDEVLESNYSILHCSPTRLKEIWAKLLEVTDTLRSKVAPLLAGGSRIAELELARKRAEGGLAELEAEVLAEIGSYADPATEEELDTTRRFLCVALGRVQAYVLEALGQILGADPRSQHDADYFLARRFARDVDEAEWLEASVARLEAYLRGLTRERQASLAEIADEIGAQDRLPSHDRWQPVAVFLDELRRKLARELRRVIGLRGIRVDELELLEDYGSDIPTLAGTLAELYETSRVVSTRLEGTARADAGAPQREADMELVTVVTSERMALLIRDLDGHLRDLLAFVSLWRRSIGRRRALLLRKHEER